MGEGTDTSLDKRSFLKRMKKFDSRKKKKALKKELHASAK